MLISSGYMGYNKMLYKYQNTPEICIIESKSSILELLTNSYILI